MGLKPLFKFYQCLFQKYDSSRYEFREVRIRPLMPIIRQVCAWRKYGLILKRFDLDYGLRYIRFFE
jgi:hypothetical protein